MPTPPTQSDPTALSSFPFLVSPLPSFFSFSPHACLIALSLLSLFPSGDISPLQAISGTSPLSPATTQTLPNPSNRRRTPQLTPSSSCSVFRSNELKELMPRHRQLRPPSIASSSPSRMNCNTAASPTLPANGPPATDTPAMLSHASPTPNVSFHLSLFPPPPPPPSFSSSLLRLSTHSPCFRFLPPPSLLRRVSSTSTAKHHSFASLDILATTVHHPSTNNHPSPSVSPFSSSFPCSRPSPLPYCVDVLPPLPASFNRLRCVQVTPRVPPQPSLAPSSRRSSRANTHSADPLFRASLPCLTVPDTRASLRRAPTRSDQSRQPQATPRVPLQLSLTVKDHRKPPFDRHSQIA